MSVVLLGTNRLVDCHTLLSVRGQPVLRVLTEPLRVSMNVPPGLPSGIEFEITDNSIVQNPGPAQHLLRVTAQGTSVAIFWGQVSLVVAVVTEPETVHLRVDLRPLGMNFYDDALGLHVGGNAFGRNEFANCATAIALG